MKSARVIRRVYSAPIININMCCRPTVVQSQVRQSTTLEFCKSKVLYKSAGNVRHLGLGPTSKDFDEPTQLSGPLTKAHATELVLRLNNDERKMLLSALQEYESNRIKEEFEDKLAGQRWRSKLGRPSKVPTLGDVDPTGTYCPVPEDWIKKKYAATVPKPTTKELFHLSLANSVPFIGFGFLDNFIMIIAGDSIESSMSAYITLSTMAAAALGNTFSDVIGIGSSYYVERGAALLGLGAPKLAPVQLDMPVSRRFANMGRVLGITLGCFLGMTPLLFKDDEKKEEAAPGDPAAKAKPA
ncbi:transmembrane protein 65 [Amyelois transitella]|uniref:transmembrane protein 65 n=1 Tax=Amyelois transitella TaxID=680683 RepID=UPI00298F999B|nr:transmembrane protein 65 [Amyelois transitella]